MGLGFAKVRTHYACTSSRVRRAGRALSGDAVAAAVRVAASTILPPKIASSPSISSMRRSWLYFAMRSVRQREPVLIWPALVATAMSAMVVSSVSPERWLMTAV